MPDSLTHLLDGKKVVLCLGGGGVGKTTISASLALAGALRGRRAAVLTIDPARRLKDALRIPELATRPSRVPLEEAFEVAPGGELTAMMLDAKRTFDDLVSRFAPSLDAAEQVLDNRLYQYVSGRLAGSQEYMALEKLYEIATGGDFDLLVVDTPPTHHALDFLDSPQRMIDLLTSRAVSLLREPSLAILGAGSRVAQAALETILRSLERFTGLAILKEVADFLDGFEAMLDGFRERAGAVRRLLRDPQTSFVLVTSPEPFTVHETVAYHRELVGADLDLGGVVLNRVVPPEALARVREPLHDLDPALVARLTEAREELEALAARDQRMFARIRSTVGDPLPIVRVPDVTDDVSTLSGIRELAEFLVPELRRGSPRANAERDSSRAGPRPDNVMPFPDRREIG